MKSEQVDRIWHWLNGRRSVKEIWDRVQLGGFTLFDVVVEYLELLLQEGIAAEI